jgi:hypothetical protein
MISTAARTPNSGAIMGRIPGPTTGCGSRARALLGESRWEFRERFGDDFTPGWLVVSGVDARGANLPNSLVRRPPYAYNFPS